MKSKKRNMSEEEAKEFIKKLQEEREDWEKDESDL